MRVGWGTARGVLTGAHAVALPEWSAHRASIADLWKVSYLNKITGLDGIDKPDVTHGDTPALECSRATPSWFCEGRSTSSGQSASTGQLSENHCRAVSARVTWISLPERRAAIFFESPNTRQLVFVSE